MPRPYTRHRSPRAPATRGGSRETPRLERASLADRMQSARWSCAGVHWLQLVGIEIGEPERIAIRVDHLDRERSSRVLGIAWVNDSPHVPHRRGAAHAHRPLVRPVRLQEPDDSNRLVLSQQGHATLHPCKERRSARKEEAPKTLRTPCSVFQRFNSLLASSDSGSSLALRSLLFVGMMAMRVKGTTLPSNSPPISQPVSDPRHQRTSAPAKPKTARDACITAAPW